MALDGLPTVLEQTEWLLHAADGLGDVLVCRWLGAVSFERYAVDVVCKMRGNGIHR